MAKRTIAVDIGNTNTRIGLIDCFSLECIGKTTIRTIDVVKALPDAIHSVMQENKTPHPIEVIICSVVSIIPEDILSGLSPLQSQYTVSFFNYSPQLPVCITYKNPEKLGPDRIANCLYCLEKFPRKNCVIIDAGTAVTIDGLSKERNFSGGVILPGAQTQFNSLHQNTSQLPLIQTGAFTIPFPPDSTQSAIIGGVTWGLAGAVTGIVKKFTDMFKNDCVVVACGGGWETIRPFVDDTILFIPEMTLVGIGLYSVRD